MYKNQEAEYIVHYKVDDFMSSIETLANKKLEDVPLIVHNHRIIVCANQKARDNHFDVPMSQAATEELKNFLSTPFTPFI